MKKVKSASDRPISAIMGRHRPKLKSLLAKYYISIEKPIRPETGRLHSVNMHFKLKLRDFGSAVERETDAGDFVRDQSFPRSTF